VDQGVSVQALLVGGVFGSETHFESALRQLIGELELEKHVTLLGERRDAAALMGSSDIVVVPSVQPEPFGMVVIEAMALGRPVIASNAGGPAEIISDGSDGLLVRPSDPESLSSAIEGLIRDPAFARELGQNAMAKAAEYRPEAMNSRVLSIYRHLLGS
jgi:glycosyltransferase involved in cell wall biosynthesis